MNGIEPFWDRELLTASDLAPLLAQRDEVAAAAIRALIKARQTVALAESCTGGLCAALLSSIPGASEVFVSSAVVYQTRAKSLLLGLPPAFVERVGPVSAEVTRALAQAARETSQADCGLAITGWAGPSGGDARDPVGTVYLCADRVDSGRGEKRVRIDADRKTVQRAAALLALELLCRFLKA